VTILFTGMFSRHYTHGNLSVEGQVRYYHILIYRLKHHTHRSMCIKKGVAALRSNRESKISHAVLESQSGPHRPLVGRLQQRATFLFAFLAIFTETAVFLELGLSVFSGTPTHSNKKESRASSYYHPCVEELDDMDAQDPWQPFL
jgi:hypothetical protein